MANQQRYLLRVSNVQIFAELFDARKEANRRVHLHVYHLLIGQSHAYALVQAREMEQRVRLHAILVQSHFGLVEPLVFVRPPERKVGPVVAYGMQLLDELNDDAANVRVAFDSERMLEYVELVHIHFELPVCHG